MHRTHRNGPRIAALATAAALSLALTPGGTAEAVTRPKEPRELTRISTAAGEVLADERGNPLYARLTDKPGKSGCTGTCTTSWPAAVGSPKRARGVTGTLTRTAKDAAHSDKPQVVYEKHPLYYYKNDTPGRPRGQNIKGFSLLAPNGRLLSTTVRATKRASPTTPETISATSRPEPSAVAASKRAKASAKAARRSKSAKPHGTPQSPKPRSTSHSRSATTSASRPASRSAAPRPTARSGAASAPASTSRAAPDSVPAPPSGLAVGPAPSRSVGAPAVTPSGAARGGAYHPAAADRTGSTGPAQLSLAIGATVAAAAGALLTVRRLRRRASGGRR